MADPLDKPHCASNVTLMVELPLKKMMHMSIGTKGTLGGKALLHECMTEARGMHDMVCKNGNRASEALANDMFSASV